MQKLQLKSFQEIYHETLAPNKSFQNLFESYGRLLQIDENVKQQLLLRKKK